MQLRKILALTLCVMIFVNASAKSVAELAQEGKIPAINKLTGTLDLSKLRIDTIEGIETLDCVKDVRVLVLEKNPIKNLSVETLSKIPNLHTIYVGKTLIEEQAIKEIECSMPNVTVVKELSSFDSSVPKVFFILLAAHVGLFLVGQYFSPKGQGPKYTTAPQQYRTMADLNENSSSQWLAWLSRTPYRLRIRRVLVPFTGTGHRLGGVTREEAA